MALKFGAKKSTGGKASSNKTKSFAGFEYKKRDDSKMIQRATRRVSGGDSWVSDEVRFFSPKEGDHEIRILPPTWEDADHFGIDVWLHYGIGPDRSSYLCPAKMKDESCPLCDERVKAQQAGEDEYADLFSPRPRVAFFVIDRKEEKAGPLLWAPSANTEKEIVNAARDRKTNSVVSLDDPSKDGYDLSFSIEGSGIKTKYKSIQVDRRSSPLSDDEDQAAEWLEYVKEHPLPEMLVFYDAEHLAEAASGTSSRQEDEEQEKEKPAKRSVAGKRSIGKKKEEEEEDEQDEEEDEQDEGDPGLTWETVHELDEGDIEEYAERLKIPDDYFEDCDTLEQAQDKLAEFLDIEEPKKSPTKRKLGSRLAEMRKNRK